MFERFGVITMSGFELSFGCAIVGMVFLSVGDNGFVNYTFFEAFTIHWTICLYSAVASFHLSFGWVEDLGVVLFDNVLNVTCTAVA